MKVNVAHVPVRLYSTQSVALTASPTSARVSPNAGYVTRLIFVFSSCAKMTIIGYKMTSLSNS